MFGIKTQMGNYLECILYMFIIMIQSDAICNKTNVHLLRDAGEIGLAHTWAAVLFVTDFPGEEGVECCTVRICCPKATFRGTPTVFCGELGGCEATDTTVSCFKNWRLQLKGEKSTVTNPCVLVQFPSDQDFHAVKMPAFSQWEHTTCQLHSNDETED